MAVRAPLNQQKLLEKPRVRRPAGSRPVLTEDQLKTPVDGKNWASIDSFQNFATALGLGTNNQNSASYYGFNPISRNHTLVEWMYRGSWLVKRVVDCIPDDMTRAGVSYTTTMDPKQIAQLVKYQRDLGTWHKINQALKWARLYGGAGCYIMIKGQRPDTPLRMESIGKGQFMGLIVLDRWMLWPHLEDLVTEPGPHFGKPKYYDVVADGMAIPRMRFHYSRFIRFEGVELPYWQYMYENYWGISVIEPIYDRIVAFDSATTGASQLVYKAHLRTYSVEGLRELIAAGGQMYQAFLQQVNVMRMLQNNEGLTTIDAKDKFETHQYAFSGLSDMLVQFAQQLSGGAAIPLTRLFGQSPAGLNATGDADIRNYYDQVNSDQESRLRDPYSQVLECMSYSLFGKPLPDDFDYYFNPLWQMSATEKATVATSTVDAVDKAFSGGLINQRTAMKELQTSSKITGIFTNITDEDIEAADADPPEPPSQNDLSLGVAQQQNADNPQDTMVPEGDDGQEAQD